MISTNSLLITLIVDQLFLQDNTLIFFFLNSSNNSFCLVCMLWAVLIACVGLISQLAANPGPSDCAYSVAVAVWGPETMQDRRMGVWG